MKTYLFVLLLLVGLAGKSQAQSATEVQKQLDALMTETISRMNAILRTTTDAQAIALADKMTADLTPRSRAVATRMSKLTEAQRKVVVQHLQDPKNPWQTPLARLFGEMMSGKFAARMQKNPQLQAAMDRTKAITEAAKPAGTESEEHTTDESSD